MPQPDGQYINGRPEEMQAFAPEGPGQLGPQEPLRTLMDERVQDFCKFDAAVTGELTKFVADANAGFTTLSELANITGREYFQGDAAGAQAILQITDANGQW
jgi:hypothetical protein